MAFCHELVVGLWRLVINSGRVYGVYMNTGSVHCNIDMGLYSLQEMAGWWQCCVSGSRFIAGALLLLES